MGYGSCMFYPPLDDSQNLPPNGISLQIHVQSPAVKVGGNPFSFPPQRKAKKERKHTTSQKKTQGNAREITAPCCVLETVPLRPLPYKCPVRGPAPSPPPLSPHPSPPRSLPPFPLRSGGGMVTICPTFVFRRKDSTALVTISSPKSKAIPGDLGCFHPQR